MVTATRPRLSPKRFVMAAALGLWLYFLLPATATAMYELYHMLPLEPLYWLYGGLKAGSFYFDQWPYKLAACIAAGGLVILPGVLKAAFGRTSEGVEKL